MITDVWFYCAAIPAVFFYGMGKGGVGGILGMLSVPLMALRVSPVQAAAVLLPLLCAMDVMALMYHRENCDYREIKLMMPFAILGIALASYFMNSLPAQMVELIIGSLALLFLLNKLLNRNTVSSSSKTKARSLSLLSGFSSTIAHAGGPPVSMYLLPKNLPKQQLIGTSVVFFTMLNLIKLIPYSMMGQLGTENLTTSLVLIPVAFLGVRAGVWLVDKISQQLIYNISYGVLLISGSKMLYTGLSSLG